MTKIQYLSLSKPKRILVDIGNFFKGIGVGFVNFFKSIPEKLAKLGRTISGPFKTLGEAMKYGTWFTRTNFLIFGFSQLFHKEIARGILYLLYEVAYIWFLVVVGVPYLSKLGTLGTFASTSQYFDPASSPITIPGGDDSFGILLYSIVTIILGGIFVVLWYLSIRDAKSLQDNIAVGRYSTNGQFFKDLTDKSYQNLLLAVPLVGLVGFTVIPVLFMVIIGFTNYNGKTHADLFDWVALDNYTNLFSGFSTNGSGDVVTVFLKVLAWTLLWALIATVTNYVIGMLVALLINRKGIKLKKLWRTVLITTIAVPQFVSLLLINKMLANEGFLTRLFAEWGWIQAATSPFRDNVLLSRALIIIVNMWVGVPYTMLISSGLLMNIPEDLYESARIDGASPFKMFMKITLPYMLFITMPYLISQFVGNINNFNIIYLLSQGAPKYSAYNLPDSLSEVGATDLLITWIYKMSMTGDASDYAMASVLGILVFVIIAFFSLIAYGSSSSVKNEEDFQ